MKESIKRWVRKEIHDLKKQGIRNFSTIADKNTSQTNSCTKQGLDTHATISMTQTIYDSGVEESMYKICLGLIHSR